MTTEEQIKGLMEEAAAAGDDAMVCIATLAAMSQSGAVAECVIAERSGQEDTGMNNDRTWTTDADILTAADAGELWMVEDAKARAVTRATIPERDERFGSSWILVRAPAAADAIRVASRGYETEEEARLRAYQLACDFAAKRGTASTPDLRVLRLEAES